MNESHIKHLQAEWAEYKKRKLPDRVKQVEMELARYGATPTKKKDD